MGLVGASATAGGWQYLLQLPPVVVLLSVAFGLGSYVVVSWVARHSQCICTRITPARLG